MQVDTTWVEYNSRHSIPAFSGLSVYYEFSPFSGKLASGTRNRATPGKNLQNQNRRSSRTNKSSGRISRFDPGGSTRPQDPWRVNTNPRLTVSPKSLLPGARQVAGLMLSLMNLMLPPPNRTSTPPECRLLAGTNPVLSEPHATHPIRRETPPIILLSLGMVMVENSGCARAMPAPAGVVRNQKAGSTVPESVDEDLESARSNRFSGYFQKLRKSPPDLGDDAG